MKATIGPQGTVLVSMARMTAVLPQEQNGVSTATRTASTTDRREFFRRNAVSRSVEQGTGRARLRLSPIAHICDTCGYVQVIANTVLSSSNGPTDRGATHEGTQRRSAQVFPPPCITQPTALFWPNHRGMTPQPQPQLQNDEKSFRAKSNRLSLRWLESPFLGFIDIPPAPMYSGNTWKEENDLV